MIVCFWVVSFGGERCYDGLMVVGEVIGGVICVDEACLYDIIELLVDPA